MIGSLVKPPSGRPVRRLVALVSALLPVEGRVFLPVHLVRGSEGSLGGGVWGWGYHWVRVRVRVRVRVMARVRVGVGDGVRVRVRVGVRVRVRVRARARVRAKVRVRVRLRLRVWVVAPRWRVHRSDGARRWRE